MRHRWLPLLLSIAAMHALVVLGMGQAATADVFIPASSRVSGAIVEPGLRGFFYDRDDPPGTLNSLALADAIIASSSPTAIFISASVDYPAGPEKISFLPTLGGLLGVDAGSLDPSDAAALAASPMVMRFSGVIRITEGLDIDPTNTTIDVRFALGSDDGARLRIGGQTLISIDGTGVFFDFPPSQIMIANFEAPGLYLVEIVWYDHFGGIGIEWYSSIPGGPDSGGPPGTAGIVPVAVLGVLRACGGGTPCSCGDTIIADRTLTPADAVVDHGSPCPGDGLIVAAGIEVDLGGNTIAGTDLMRVGILLGSNASVKNGRVQNFDVGVKSDGTISMCQVGTDDTSLTVTINRVGIDLDADNCTIIKTAVTANLSDGAVVRGDASTFLRNTCSRNGGTGLVVQGSDNLLNQNRCELNGGDGISVTGDTNTLLRNLGGRNGGTGVLVDGSGNTFEHNQGRTNDGGGIRGIGTMIESDGRNYGAGNGGVNCEIDGFPSLAGGYC